MKEKKLRVAPLIRVSTEKQATQGESLQTQRQQIELAVSQIGGVIPEYCLNRYAGQEHGTRDYERKMMDQLLEDSGKDLFDAVMVADESRWSRDNEKSKKGLRLLEGNKIRFFVLSKEYHLKMGEDRFLLGLYAEINELDAYKRNKISLKNRIERARRNIPVVGKLPFGRTYDKNNNKWGIDKKKQRMIQRAAKKYLDGESLSAIAEREGINHSSLHKTLTKRSGSIWIQSFKSEKLGIDEKIETEIPRLLDEKTIKKIQDRAQANKTYQHGHIKHKYLLSRMIFCGECGLTLDGQTNQRGKQYYRHRLRNKSGCKVGAYLPAPLIEQAVLIHLFATFGDEASLEKAVRNVIPSSSEIETLQEDLVDYYDKLQKIKKAKQRLIKAFADGTLRDDQIKEEMDSREEEERAISVEIEKLKSKLETSPSANEIEETGKKVRRKFKRFGDSIKIAHMKSFYNCFVHFQQMSYDEKKEMMQSFFAGKDEDQKRRGVYIFKDGDKWSFEIRGIMGNIKNNLPLTADDARALLGIDDDDTVDPFAGSAQDLSSKCHAHHSERIH
jgi:DNA invertase Pin-like site-specific DNA recombinase